MLILRNESRPASTHAIGPTLPSRSTSGRSYVSQRHTHRPLRKPQQRGSRRLSQQEQNRGRCCRSAPARWPDPDHPARPTHSRGRNRDRLSVGNNAPAGRHGHECTATCNGAKPGPRVGGRYAPERNSANTRTSPADGADASTSTCTCTRRATGPGRSCRYTCDDPNH